MNILITGANGQLGNEMRALAANHTSHTYFFTDVDELDICNESAVNAFFEKNSINIIVNCAAYTAVDAAEDNEELSNKLNNTAPGYLAKAAQKNGASFIHISTDYVFDGTNHIPYTEDQPTCPASVYGSTKLAGEKNVMANCDRVAVIRTAWLYSTFGNNFVKTMIRLGRERSTLGVIFDQVGTPTYAHDLAKTIYAMIETGVARGIYHFSNEGVCSWYDFTIAIHHFAGIKNCKVKPIHTADYPTKAARPHYSVLDKTKIKKIYNIEIPHWEESLKHCIAELNNQLSILN
jgi:dTDP-4-dehydrorhamnose reductase